jgi:HD-GYP domain-containing protein (c-di-GMP phosphodiesterase class II)
LLLRLLLAQTPVLLQRVPRGPLFFLTARLSLESFGEQHQLKPFAIAVKLVALSPQDLRVKEALPFGVRDAEGRLLLGAGQVIDSRSALDELLMLPLFIEETESQDWNRRVAAAMDLALRQGAALKDVVAARPEPVNKDAAQSRQLTLIESWQELVLQLDSVLRDVRPGSDWRTRLMSVHGRARALTEKRPDGSLYHLVFEAGSSLQRYSCNHALLSLVICEQTAAMLGWAPEWVDSLGRSALLMNVAMLRLQDQLATALVAPTAGMRRVIDTHPEAGAQMLAAAGWTDKLCLDVVRAHHDVDDLTRPLADLSPAEQLTRLLHRVDVFAAKISLRATRQPMSPVQAAREACLGAGGVPDEIGSALLRTVGLYPPGSFVELASGEVGIVIKRGRRANLPLVASLVSASGNVVAEPAVRDTLDQRHAVKSALAPAQVKVRPPHERLMALR